jgi:hypothetical protein
LGSGPVPGTIPGRPLREIRAHFDEKTIRVYQAYSPAIAVPALQAQKFVPPFSLSRMTWIKPSFTWMMYRSGWAEKPGQECILGIDILRSGFEWALAHSCLSHFDAAIHASREGWEEMLRNSPVRIQWDPERDAHLRPLAWRAIQIGLGPVAAREYAEKWTVRIEDVTSLAKDIHAQIARGDGTALNTQIGMERPYLLPKEIASRLGIR